MEGQSPNDAEFFKLINPIATFIVGALAGLMAGQGSGSIKPKKTEGEEDELPKLDGAPTEKVGGNTKLSSVRTKEKSANTQNRFLEKLYK